MAKKKSASLSAGLLVRKGAAAPATSSKPSGTPAPAAPAARGDTKDKIALTVKLDPERYHRLLGYGTRFAPRRSNQDIVVAALDAYLEAQE